MSEMQQVSLADALINRLTERLGQAAVQIEALQLQLESAQNENEQLRARIAELEASLLIDNHVNEAAYQGGAPI